MAYRAALALGMASCFTSCGEGQGDPHPYGDPIGQPSTTREGSGCDDIGRPCGLTVRFEPSELPLGSYSIEVTTSAGVTRCIFPVEAERLQTPEEAMAQDAILAQCAEQGTCPPGRCTGTNIVYVGSDGLTIVDESSQISVRVRDIEAGSEVEQDFTPMYMEHPARTERCHLCRVANESMSLPL
jgi:hypothetical protein